MVILVIYNVGKHSYAGNLGNAGNTSILGNTGNAGKHSNASRMVLLIM